MSADGYLPPGCSHRDVDRAAAERHDDEAEACPVCGGFGEFIRGRMTCCGATAKDINEE